MDVNIKSPSPLAFDRVMEGTAVTALNSPLFKIPTEILAIIVNYIAMSNDDIASLALVNSDCRQLARSCQFRTVTLDASHRSGSILGILQREAVERRRNHGHTRSPSLSACIRRVAVNNSGYWDEIIALKPRKPGRSIEDTSDDAFDDDEGKVQQWRASAGALGQKLSEIYRPNVLFVISSLVHLESLAMSQAGWSQSLLNSLTACTLRHLSLRDVQMTDVIPVMDGSVIWPLETLDISLGWDFHFSRSSNRPSLNASSSWNTILRLCSASLKVLFLSHRVALGKKEDAVSFSLQFPLLRQLDLTWESHLDQSALRSLILTSPQLSTLAINYGHQATRELLDREGEIQSLETLVLHQSIEKVPDDSPLDFLKKNPQLKAFAFHGAGTSTLLKRILSLLTTVAQPRKLSMTWDGVLIPDSSLDALSSLSSVEVLHLSSGFQDGWRHDWPIRHDTIISHLKPLRGLRRLAFTRDVYSYSRQGQLFEYSSYLQLRDEAWELHHRCMRAEAIKYAKAFPNLEFIHVGKISFKVSHVKNGLELEATDDEEFSWLRSMFGISR